MTTTFITHILSNSDFFVSIRKCMYEMQKFCISWIYECLLKKPVWVVWIDAGTKNKSYLLPLSSRTRRLCPWLWFLRRLPMTREVAGGSWRAPGHPPGVWRSQAAQPEPTAPRPRRRWCPSRRGWARSVSAPRQGPARLSTAFWSNWDVAASWNSDTVLQISLAMDAPQHIS